MVDERAGELDPEVSSELAVKESPGIPGRPGLGSLDRRRLFCFGFGPWKFGFVRAYLAECEPQLLFCNRAWQARLMGFDASAAILVWGVRDHRSVRTLSARSGVPIWRMEDGFLRSVGLGSDFHLPASLVLDQRGIYFDPGGPSDLEHILQTQAFEPAELERARELRRSIVAAALTKYNLARVPRKLARPGHPRVILVPGQVEQDASIRLGCVDIRTNLGLLAEVRSQNPDAYLIYKPHPDVVSGNRRGGRISEARARELCDQVESDAPLPACLEIADEVHTMTSLVGFEALLRGLRVTTYGRPFYSGWGLTQDRHLVPRRTRRLTLDMLVAGALLRYPLYLSPRTLRLTTPEAVVGELVEELRAADPLKREGGWKRRARMLRHALRGIFHGS